MIVQRLPWCRDCLLKAELPNKPGVYFLYGKNGQLLYTGHASRLRHRLQSYWQVDDFGVHPTKDGLRGKIGSFAFVVMPEQKARFIEKRVKYILPHNFK